MTGIPVKQLQEKDGTNFQPNVPDKVGYVGSWKSDITPDTEYIANDDGYIMFWGSVTNSGSEIKAVAGSQVFEIRNAGSNPFYFKNVIPVQNGMNFKVTMTGSVTGFGASLWMLVKGGGEFDALMVSTTLEMGVV